MASGIQRRDERIDVIDPATNTVLATQTLTNFFGEYVSFNIKGGVILRVTNLAPPGPSSSNAIVSGIFFGAAAAVSTPTASLVGTDSTTLGNWRTAYGGDGYDIAQDTSGGNPVQPSYGQVTVSGASNFTWASPSTSPYALQDAAGTAALEATWYSPTSFDIDVDLTDGQAHEVTLYALDWDAVVGAGIQRRVDRIDVIDPATNTVLATQTVNNFLGEYVSFNIKGGVILRVTNLAPPGPSSSNAIVSGIFFGAAAAVSTPTASLLGTDSSTLGSWRSAYGGDGYDIAQDTSGANPVLPSYAQVTLSGASDFTWQSPSTSPYALQDADGSAALEATWYSLTSFDIDVNLTDGEAHEVTLYALDWDAVVGAGIQRRDERIDVIDPASNTVLATETLTSFLGEYVSFSISGSVIIRVTNLAPPGPSSSNAVVSGIFFGTGLA